MLLQVDEHLRVPLGGLTDMAVLMNLIERSGAADATVRAITDAFDEENESVASASGWKTGEPRAAALEALKRVAVLLHGDSVAAWKMKVVNTWAKKKLISSSKCAPWLRYTRSARTSAVD